MTPLHFALSSEYIETASLLIKKGADVNAKDEDGNTPLHGASYSENIEIASLPIDNGADINAKDKYGRTPLHIASLYGKKRQPFFLLKKELMLTLKMKVARLLFMKLYLQEIQK